MISFPIPNNTNTERKDLSQYLNACMFADPLDYRLQRSENLLMRMICCKKLDTSQMSLMRLSKGVFVHQVWESSSPHSSPTLSTIESALYNQAVDFNDEAPIDNFHFNKIYQTQPFSYDTFIPFSYTFGVRFTNPYSDSHDLIVRGKIPVWCQTLFLSTCFKQSSIQPHVPHAGLFPFAPHITVTFKPFDHHLTAIPELTLLYERLSMEYDDPYSLPNDEDEIDWPKHKQAIMANMLICDIPDEVAKLVENMGAIWAASQGFFF
ncbi:hypothetical protein G6F46_005548 [Rhizopus delemar]|nr:hypothetical protein G6F55_007423 [Rhizopus delemar]KAG1540084.1 hypothetical protein G6F51_008742 [Rhizopus arrhizus]KAG1494326.1 hypothetical protein G6F54_007951 [Rhizopus delemar]KAG1508385.1 hypothetical protein G6F53_008231 [Rhizopus delemar]KAG1518437.1 hypothetical protein G6F52_009022 [Rhizopus delemar]